MITSFILSISLLCSFCIQAEQSSAIIQFGNILKADFSNLPEQDEAITRKARAAQEELVDTINQTLNQGATEFLQQACKSNQLHTFIQHRMTELNNRIQGSAQKHAAAYAEFMMNDLIKQVAGHLSLHKHITENNHVLVVFTAQWSPACQVITPILETLATRYKNKISLIAIDVSEFKILDMPINDIPTMVFFNKGEEVHRAIGLNNELIQSISQKYKQKTDTQELEAELMKALEEDIQQKIKKFFFS